MTSCGSRPRAHPCGRERRLAIVGAARRHAARERHGVDLSRSFVARGEREQPAVGRNDRIRLLGRVARETTRQAAFDGHRPQVAFGGEDNGLAVDRGEAIEAERTWLSGGILRW